MSIHRCRAYYTYEEWSKVWTPKAQRWARRVWKNHVARNGNTPILIKCAVCSGDERRQDIKHGRWRVARPSRVLRDEQRDF